MHEISAVVTPEEQAAEVARAMGQFRIVKADGPWCLLPLVGFQVPDLEEATAGDALRQALSSLLQDLKAARVETPVALVFTQIWGGAGTQAGVVVAGSTILFGPVVSPRAINESLARLGVEPRAGLDLFDSIGLGRWRSVDEMV